jgi:hypothetical protein
MKHTKRFASIALIQLRTATAVVATTVTLDAFAADQILTCPEKIDGAHVKLIYAEDGWTPFVESHLRLTGISFMDGAPEKIGHLKPFTTSKYKKNDSDTWKFEGDFPEGKWLSCLYDGTQISLSKRIDDRLSECSATRFKEKKFGTTIFEIRCK